MQLAAPRRCGSVQTDPLPTALWFSELYLAASCSPAFAPQRKRSLRAKTKAQRLGTFPFGITRWVPLPPRTLPRLSSRVSGSRRAPCARSCGESHQQDELSPLNKVATEGSAFALICRSPNHISQPVVAQPFAPQRKRSLRAETKAQRLGILVGPASLLVDPKPRASLCLMNEGWFGACSPGRRDVHSVAGPGDFSFWYHPLGAAPPHTHPRCHPGVTRAPARGLAAKVTNRMSFRPSTKLRPRDLLLL